jgi:mannose-6-phosphate isomerase-like protein (cupin superfamily)
MISKIEHDVALPSHDTLRKIAVELHVSLSDLIDPESSRAAMADNSGRAGRISLVRPQERKLLRLPHSGMTYQILTPDLQGEAEFVWLETDPGEGGVEFFSHERGEECILVLEGSLHVLIEVENEKRTFVLNKGDCLTFDARLPHRYANEGSKKAVWVYIAVPPAL